MTKKITTKAYIESFLNKIISTFWDGTFGYVDVVKCSLFKRAVLPNFRSEPVSSSSTTRSISAIIDSLFLKLYLHIHWCSKHLSIYRKWEYVSLENQQDQRESTQNAYQINHPLHQSTKILLIDGLAFDLLQLRRKSLTTLFFTNKPLLPLSSSSNTSSKTELLIDQFLSGILPVAQIPNAIRVFLVVLVLGVARLLILCFHFNSSLIRFVICLSIE